MHTCESLYQTSKSTVLIIIICNVHDLRWVKSKLELFSLAENSLLLLLFGFYHQHCCRDPSLQVRACNLLGGYLTHKETNMRYMSLESLSHLAISDLSREAVKKHQDVVLKSLKVAII